MPFRFPTSCARPPTHAQEIVGVAHQAGFKVISLAGWLDEEHSTELSLGTGDWRLYTMSYQAVAHRLREPLQRQIP